MRHVLTASLGVLALAACGGGSAPTAPTPAPAPATSPSPAAPMVLRMASLRGVNGHGAGGTARILRDGTSHALELGSDFRIDSGNTDVYLTAQPDTVRSTDLNLGEMRSLTGMQVYAMPHDGAAYRYVMLWCRPFRVPIGLGELQ
jgi:electron transfer DM13